MPQDILILGASIRAAAQSACRAGYTPFGADLFCDVDTQQCAKVSRCESYPKGLVAAAEAVQSTRWMYTGALENHPKLIDIISARHKLLGNDAATVRRVQNLELLQAVFSDNGISFPDTRATPEGLPRDGSWLRKASKSAGGMHVDIWNDDCSKCAKRGKYVWQRKVVGRSTSGVFVADGNRARLLGVTAQRLVDADRGDFRYAGSSTVLPERDEIADQLEQAGSVVATEFQLAGLFGIDAIFDGRTVWPIEVNPRYTASIEILERAGGFSAVDLHFAACTGSKVDDAATQSLGCHAAKRIVYAVHDLTINDAFADWVYSLNATEQWPAIADIPAVGTKILADQPIATLLVSGASSNVIDRREQTRIEQMRRTLNM
ncbi:MAG: ATP-grasp domain-containing protein [Pirellulales bacterium]|nr:ATP-grasp domain-containing protein [Pirellulales bacterium]